MKMIRLTVGLFAAIFVTCASAADVLPTLMRCDPVASPAPVYPATSLKLAEEGSVILSFTLDGEGQPIDVRMEQSSNHKRLDVAAVEAVRNWRFSPGACVPVSALQKRMRVPIVFRLSDELSPSTKSPVQP